MEMGNAFQQSDADRPLAGMCGAFCGHCAAYLAEVCRGCAYSLGFSPHGECPIFTCAAGARGVEHCGLCPEFPCAAYCRHVAPDVFEARVHALRRRAALGTLSWLEECRHEGSEPAT